MIVKKEGKWWVVHAHPQKAGSATDKPIGTIIKCFQTEKEANAMHNAILTSQAIKKEKS